MWLLEAPGTIPMCTTNECGFYRQLVDLTYKNEYGELGYTRGRGNLVILFVKLVTG